MIAGIAAAEGRRVRFWDRAARIAAVAGLLLSVAWALGLAYGLVRCVVWLAA